MMRERNVKSSDVELSYNEHIEPEKEQTHGTDKPGTENG